MNLNNTFYIEANFTPSLFDNEEKSLYSDDFIKEIMCKPDDNYYHIFSFNYIELDEKLNMNFDTYKNLMLIFNEEYTSSTNNLLMNILPQIEHKIEMYSYYLEMKKYNKK
jgi:hypothetical protein